MGAIFARGKKEGGEYDSSLSDKSSTLYQMTRVPDSIITPPPPQIPTGSELFCSVGQNWLPNAGSEVRHTFPPSLAHSSSWGRPQLHSKSQTAPRNFLSQPLYGLPSSATSRQLRMAVHTTKPIW